METKAHHALIGAFTLATLACVLLFALWAAKWSSEKSFTEYDVVFREAVSGLSVGGLVQYNGITVGNVRRLSLAPEDPRRVIARIRVAVDTPVKVDTQAKLAITGLTGVAFIQLSGGTPDAARLHPAPGEDVAVIAASPSALSRLFESSEDIATTATDILLRIKAVLDDENLMRIDNALANVEAVSASVAAQREDIGALIRSTRASADRLERVLAGAEGVIGRADASLAAIDADVVQRLPALVERLDATLAQLESASASADAILGDNRAVIGEFTHETLPAVGPTIEELRALTRDLRRISERLDRDPAAYVLGRGRPEEFEP